MISVNQFLALSKNAYVQWAKARAEYGSVREQLAMVKKVTERTSEYSSISESPTARRRNDGDDAYKGTLKQGFTKNFTQVEIALQTDVTKQLRMFDKYDEIMKRMRNMGRAAERRIEIDIASLLSYAWSTTYTNLDGETVTVSTPDGLALIDNAHSANGSSNTFTNEISTTHSPISTAVLESLEGLFDSFIDDTDGRAFSPTPDTIIHGKHAPTRHTILRILNSELIAGSNNNDKNTFKNEYSVLEVPYLNFNAATEARDSTKDRYVFVAALKNKDQNGFCVEVSQDMKFEVPFQVTESSVWQFLTTMLYDFGTTRANFIVGTKGDGTAV